MADSWFQIDVALPIALQGPIGQGIVAAIQPKWRITHIELRKTEEGVFRLKLSIDDQERVLANATIDQLRTFRDFVLGLVSFATMVPVQLRSKGIFDFPVVGRQRKQISLGPMNVQYPGVPYGDYRALVMGLGLDDKYASVLHFLRAALNSEHPLYRFINLAVATELIVRHDSPIASSRSPCCGNPKCDFRLEECPKCRRSWKIPETLRERAAFLVPPQTLSAFVRARNHVFHGLSDELHYDFADTLPGLNAELLVLLRNYIGTKMNLPAIRQEQLSIALHPPEVSMTIHYTPPEEEPNKPKEDRVSG